MFKPTSTSPRLSFGQLFTWIGTQNDQIKLPRGKTSDFHQHSNWLQHDLISVWVNL